MGNVTHLVQLAGEAGAPGLEWLASLVAPHPRYRPDTASLRSCDGQYTALTWSAGTIGPMSPRTVDLIISVSVLLLGLVPMAWPGTGPAVVGLLFWIAGVIGPPVVARV